MYSTKRPHKFFYLLTVVVFLTQLVLPTAARAQGEVPPADPAATSVPASTDAAPTDPAASPTDAAPTDAPVDAVTPAPTDTAPAEPAVDVTEVPAGTDVVVLDESGNPLPLAAQAASDALVVGDPMWCPELITPGGAGCTGSYSTLTDLLANPLVGSDNGVIWIQSGVRSEGEATHVVISNSTTNRLTLMGGWDGSIGSTATNTATPSTYSVPIEIYWGGNLNIYNLSFDSTTFGGYSLIANTGGSLDADNISVIDSNGSGALFQAVDSITVDDSTFEDNNGNGLVVNQTGAGSQHHNTVRLKDVNASYNNGNGVQVNSVSGEVDVKGSAAQYSVFSQNTSDGLNIDAAGVTFIQYVSSTGNYVDGADIFTQTGDIAIQNSAFDNNDGDGLKAHTDGGNITLNDVSADSNDDYGAYMWADNGDISITNYSTFDYNGDDGLYAGTDYGNITLDEVSAYDNSYDGAYLETFSAGDVTVTNSDFNSNGDSGLVVDAGYEYCDWESDLTCNITLNNVEAGWYDYEFDEYYGNGEYGADLGTGYGDITVTDSSFEENWWTGLYAWTDEGNIALDNVYANYNGDHGINLETYYGGNVDITNSGAEYNSDAGIEVDAGSDGCDWEDSWTCNITLDNVYANYNDYFGASLWTNLGDITVTDSEFDENYEVKYCDIDCWWEYGTGLDASTYEGDIIVDYVDAEYNDNYGADLWSDDGDVKVTNSGFYDNGNDGLYAGTDYGDITLDEVSADDNSDYGAYLDSDGSGDIFVTNSSFDNNYDSGLYAWAYDGNVSLDHADANWNDDYGVEIETGSGSVTVKNSDYYENGDSGLYVETGQQEFIGLDESNNPIYDGCFLEGGCNITVNDVTSDWNGDSGVELYTYYGGTVTIGGDFNTFDDNYYTGIYVETGYYDCAWGLCDITINNVQANNNEYDYSGAYLATYYGGNVTVSNSSFMGNDESGLEVEAGYEWCEYGTCNITLNNVTAGDNYWNGADLYSDDGDITITDSTFNYNDFAGVYAYADWGNISLTGVDAFYNGAQGADLETHDGGSVFVTDSNFNENTQLFDSYYAGLEVNAGDNGCEWFGGCNITLTGVVASSNWVDDGDMWWGGYGADLWSNWGTVSVYKSIFANNGDNDGLSASTDYGNIFVDQVIAYGNDGDGVELWSNYGGDVTVTNTTSYDNQYGFDIATADDASQCEGDYTCNVFMSGVVAYGNEYNGADVYADSGSIFVSNSSFTGTTDGDGFYGQAGWSDWNNDLELYESYCFPGPCDITFDDVNASGNVFDGANLWSYGGNVSVSDSTFNGNGNDGLSIGVADQSNNFRTISAPTLPTIALENVDASGNGDEGFVFYGYPGGFADDEYSDPANITIVCSTFNDNASYGLDIFNEGGTVTMGDVTALGNNLGGIQTSIFPSPIAGGNCYVVGENRKSFEYYEDAQTGEGATVPFACEQFYGLHLWLVSGDFVEIPCSSRGTGTHAIAYTVPGANLPAMPNGTFMSALHFTVLDAHNIGQVLVSFKLAAGETGAGYSIVHWNGTAWETVSNASLIGGYFQAWVNQVGIYALVKN